MRLTFHLAWGLLIVTGCTSSSGVLKVAPDTYTVSASSPTGVEARKVALTEANEYCSKLGREIVVTNEKISAPSIDITFRCAALGN
jgi:hypothetical protein